MSTEKNRTVAIAIDSISRDLKAQMKHGLPFESRLSITVQNGTPITLKHRFQNDAVTDYSKQSSLEVATQQFTEKVMLWLQKHDFFVASIEVAFDGFDFFAKSPICESSVRLTV